MGNGSITIEQVRLEGDEQPVEWGTIAALAGLGKGPTTE
jgi:hypothetical protein